MAKKSKSDSDFSIDLTFLDQEPWNKVQQSRDELEAELLDIWEQESVLRANLKANDPKKFEKKVLSTFEGRMRRKLGGQSTPGKGYIFGMSMPFDSTGAMIGKALRMYEEDPSGAKGVYVKVIKNKETGKKKVIPIDYRDPKKSKTSGQPMKGSNWMTTIVGMWKPKDDKAAKLKPFVTIAGGQGGDHLVSLKCPKCGTEDVFATCSECGAEKPSFILPKVLPMAFTPALFDMRVQISEDGVERIAWANNTQVKANDKASEKETDVGAIFSGTKALLAHKITSKTLRATLKKHGKDRNWWVWMECEVSQVVATPDKKGNMKFIVGDDQLELLDANGRVVQGITVKLPPHVWEYQVKGKIGAGSSVIVTGQLNSFKGQDQKTIINLEAMGVYGIPDLVTIPPNDDGSGTEDEDKDVDETLGGVNLGESESEEDLDEDEESEDDESEEEEDEDETEDSAESDDEAEASDDEDESKSDDSDESEEEDSGSEDEDEDDSSLEEAWHG